MEYKGKKIMDIDMEEAGQAADSKNVLNYVIAIAMLAGSLQIVGASGAAGANFAQTGSKLVNNQAAKFSRRYPLAMASRTGAFAASGFVNERGEARKIFGVQNWNKTPFFGGRIQRLAQQAQGYDAARREKEQKEELKYIKPTQQQAFYESQETLGLGRGRVGRALGRAYSTVASQGGNLDKDISLSQIRVDRGDWDPENEADIKRISGFLRQAGDEQGLLFVTS